MSNKKVTEEIFTEMVAFYQEGAKKFNPSAIEKRGGPKRQTLQYRINRLKGGTL